METNTCDKHGIKKQYQVCFSKNCRNQLICWKCHQEDQVHKDNQHSSMNYLMIRNQSECKMIFSEVVNESVMETNDVDQFVEVFEKKMEKIIVDKKQNVQIIGQLVTDNLESTIGQWKTSLFEQLKQSDYKRVFEIQKEIVDSVDSGVGICQLDVLWKEFREMKREQQQMKVQQDRMQKQIEKQNKIYCQENNWEYERVKLELVDEQLQDQDRIAQIRYIKELNKCKNEVRIYEGYKVSDYKNEINKYKQKNEQYKIWINFDDNSSLEYKIKIINMIDELDANQNVGGILIGLSNTNQIDYYVITSIIKNYQNIFCIGIYDYFNTVQNDTHNLIKQLVEQSVLLEFVLLFEGGLSETDEGLQLMKQYNNMVGSKRHLERLCYKNSRINEYSQSRQEIQLMIDEVNQM